MIFLLQTLSLLLPILVAGVILIVAIKFKLFLWLDYPVDFGAKVGRRRLFGANKTWRGVTIYIVGAILVCCLLWLGAESDIGWIHPIFGHNPLVVGVLYGGSYSAGELINSFIKRRLDIGPGQSTGALQYFFDTVDGMLLTIVVLSVFYGADWRQLLLVFTIGIALHLFTDFVMKKHRLKK